MKTLIELFDSNQIENVVTGLSFLPDKIIFVGFKEIMNNKRISFLTEFFEIKSLNIKLEFVIVDRYDYDSIYNRLNTILDNNEDCVFDLTGGRELVLAAMGAISESRNIPMLQYNISRSEIVKVANCSSGFIPKKASVSINESIILNGGLIVEDAIDNFEWDMNYEFRRDIDIMWQICRLDCSAWNKFSKALGNLSIYGKTHDELWISFENNSVVSPNTDTNPDENILNKLINKGIITDYKKSINKTEFRYKNSQIKQCLIKAGNVLELYTYLAAIEITEEYDGYYDDIDVSVHIDWDGIIHEKFMSVKDTRNEIDVMLTRKLKPVFISCKNGEVHNEALYELFAVAEKFGGKYSKKILVATHVTSSYESRKFKLQRARDMKIDVIYDIDKMSKEEFKELLINKTR